MRLTAPSAAWMLTALLTLTACSGGGSGDEPANEPTANLQGEDGVAAATLTYSNLSQISTYYHPRILSATLLVAYALAVSDDAQDEVDGTTTIFSGSCIGGGSIEVTSTLTPDGPVAGDGTSAELIDCAPDEFSGTENGSLSVSFDSGTPTENDYRSTVTINQYALSEFDGLTTSTITKNGIFNITVSPDGDKVRYDHTTDDFSRIFESKAGNVVTQSLGFKIENLSASAYVDEAAGSMSYEADFRFEARDTDGEAQTIDVSISPPFVFDSFLFATDLFEFDDDYPKSGIMTLTGANQSQVILDAGTGDPDTLNLTVDGQTLTMFWTDLSPLNL